MEQLSKEKAIEFAKSKLWEDMTHEEIAKFQICQDKLCVPFDVFHESIEEALQRPVYIHEFGLNREGLKAELFDGEPPPSLEELLKLLPQEKLIIVSNENPEKEDWN